MASATVPGPPALPASPTLFRALIKDPELPGLVARMMAGLAPPLRQRFRPYLEPIEQATTLSALLDAAWAAQGPAEPLWHQRLATYGTAALPAISARLRAVGRVRDKGRRRVLLQRLVGELRWRGDAGASVLQEQFDELDDYGRAYAAVALGLLGATAAADRLWAFYERVEGNRTIDPLVGALWGLVDMGDRRAGEALIGLVGRRRHFYDLYGLLALAGNARAATLLAGHIVSLPGREREAAMLAMVAMGHRAGRAELLAHFIAAMRPGDTLREVTEVVDELLSRPPAAPEQYFELFYHGFTAGNLARIMPA